MLSSKNQVVEWKCQLCEGGNVVCQGSPRLGLHRAPCCIVLQHLQTLPTLHTIYVQQFFCLIFFFRSGTISKDNLRTVLKNLGFVIDQDTFDKLFEMWVKKSLFRKSYSKLFTVIWTVRYRCSVKNWARFLETEGGAPQSFTSSASLRSPDFMSHINISDAIQIILVISTTKNLPNTWRKTSL